MSYQVPATQHGFKQSGRMLLITYEVSELNNPDVAKIALHGENYGWLTFSQEKDSLENVELPKLPKSGKKSKSELLRAVLFLLWQSSGSKDTQEDFYAKEMDRIIDHYKGKL